MTQDGCDPRRIAQIIVDGSPGGSRRGSGYLVTGTSVLTAAHVVNDATRVVVRLDAGQDSEWTADATVVWSDREHDLAVLSVSPPGGLPAFGPVLFGGMAGTAAVIDVHAAGFPLWKQREAEDGRPYRDLHDAAGRLAVLSNRRGGTAEITVGPPGAGGATPWQGMSGAAVWAGAHIIGVVTHVYHQEGPGRLTATRIDHTLRRIDGDARRALIRLLEIPGHGDLVDVTPPPTGWRFSSGYREQVRDIAPAGGLHERGAELDELAAFCAGDEPYVWWQAGPWAGKTALMSTFALNPPAGVDVVSFFVTARLASQADSVAFTDALLDQLAALIGEVLPAAITTGIARDSHRRALLREAVTRCERASRRLVLLVDGLDEDSGGRPGSGLASIASLLPKVVDAGLRVIVSSRPNPPVPSDVPPDHPLQRCRRRQLAVSSYATETAMLARRELDEVLNGSQVGQDVLGLVVAAGGGLNLGELEELSGQPRFVLDAMLGGVFGRTIGAREEAAGRSTQRSFTLAHETLRVEAIDRLGAQRLTKYRMRLHDWADMYRDRGWPPETPVYLLRGYPRMVEEAGDHRRMVALALDAARHDRNLLLTGGDAASLRELKVAQELVSAQPRPSLTDLACLAMRRDDLLARNSNIPLDLPAVWAALGQHARAHALIDGVVDPQRRAATLAALAEVTASGGDHERIAAVRGAVEGLIRSWPAPDRSAQMTAHLARALAHLGRPGDARTLTGTVGDPATAAAVLLDLLGTVTDPALAEDVALDVLDTLGRITDTGAAGRLSARAALVLARRGDHGRGRALLDAGESAADQVDPDHRATKLAVLAQAATALGDHGLARRLAVRAEQELRSVSIDVRPRLREMVDDAVRRAEFSWAETLAQQVTPHQEHVAALVAVAAGGWPDRPDVTRRLLTVIDQVLAGRDAQLPRDTLIDLAFVHLVSGDTDRAVKLAGYAGGRHEASAMLARLALRAGRVRAFDAAVAVTDRIRPVPRRCLVAAWLASVLAEAGETDWARALTAWVSGRIDDIAEPGVRELVRDELRAAEAAMARPAGRSPTTRTRPAGPRSTAGPFTPGPRPVTQPSPRNARPRRTNALRLLRGGPLLMPDDPSATAGSRIVEFEPVEDGWVTDETRLAGLPPTDEAGDDPVREPDGDAADQLRRLLGAPGPWSAQEHASRVVMAQILAGRAATLDEQASMVAHIALTTIRAGAHDLALGVARAPLYALRQTPVMSDVMDAALAVADLERAETVARNIHDRPLRSLALARLSKLAETRGEDARAARLRGEAERVAYAITDQQRRAGALTGLAQWLAGNGEEVRAAEVASDAETDARVLTDPVRQATALAHLANALLAAGADEQAHALAVAGVHIVATLSDQSLQNELSVRLIRPLKASGTHDDLVRSIVVRLVDPFRLARELIDLSGGRVVPSDELLLGVDDPVARAVVSFHHACVTGDTGKLDDAERIAQGITDPGAGVVALARLAVIAAGHGLRRRVASLSERATEIMDGPEVTTEIPPGRKDEARGHLARAAGDLGEHADAWRISDAIQDASRRAVVLALLGDMLAGRDDAAGSATFVTAAVASCRQVMNPALRAMTLTRVARSAGRAGDRQLVADLCREAETVASGIAQPTPRALAWADIARTYGLHDASAAGAAAARRLVVSALEIADWSTVLPALEVLEPAALSALAQLAARPTAGTAED